MFHKIIFFTTMPQCLTCVFWLSLCDIPVGKTINRFLKVWVSWRKQLCRLFSYGDFAITITYSWQYAMVMIVRDNSSVFLGRAILCISRNVLCRAWCFLTNSWECYVFRFHDYIYILYIYIYIYIYIYVSAQSKLNNQYVYRHSQLWEWRQLVTSVPVHNEN